jgi:mono/diheme cytochrome c family protein
MRIIGILIAIVILLIAASLVFIYSGVYNVAATEPHIKPVEWLLNMTLEKSVSRHAKGIEAPPLSDDSLVQTGFIHYKEMCVTCHGAPGVSPSEIGKGLNPEPPELVEELEESGWNTEQLFWITKYGIKMTGMPAFGPTHSDEEIWAIVAFLERLPDLSPEEYRAMDEATKDKQHEHGHSHEHGQMQEQKENKKEGEIHIHDDGRKHIH